jgi:CheY-like chemotaxis protein
LNVICEEFGSTKVAGTVQPDLEDWLSEPTGLVVSDIQMPGMNGFELLREIRLFGPDAGGRVPVIAVTAFVTCADRARILNAGFQACLPKPFTPDKLSEAILTVLNN